MIQHPPQHMLSAFIDDMLDVPQMHETARHIAACAACRTDSNALRDTRARLRHLPTPPAPPPDFWVNAYRQLRVADAAEKQRSTPLMQWRQTLVGTQRRWAAGAAVAAVLGAAVAAPLLSGGHHNALPGTPAAAVAASDTVDLSALVRDHAQSAGAQPLADTDRQQMLSADADEATSAADAGTEASANGTLLGNASP